MFVLAGLPVVSQLEKPLIQFLIIHDYEAAVTVTAEVFCWIKTETPRMADCARAAPVLFRPVGLA